MIRQAPRLLRASQQCLRAPATHRFLSTAPPSQKSRSWKGLGARWGLAIGAIYYYNTSNLFAEEPPFSAPPPQELRSDALSPSPILSTAASSRRQHYSTPTPPPPPPETPLSPTPEETANASLQETEEEASSEGAFNPTTGEINWDCPCLGGMAHGPCGEQFRAAFSCFVYSEQEPKGMDCIEKFKGMQDCFRDFPDVYGSELEEKGVEEGLAEGMVGGEGAEVPAEGAPLGAEGKVEGMALGDTSQKMEEGTGAASETETGSSSVGEIASRAKAATEKVKDKLVGEPTSESDGLVPKAAHDATSANVGK